MKDFNDQTGYSSRSKRERRDQFKKLVKKYYESVILRQLSTSQIFITKQEKSDTLQFLTFVLSPEKWRNSRTNVRSRAMYDTFSAVIYSFT